MRTLVSEGETSTLLPSPLHVSSAATASSSESPSAIISATRSGLKRGGLATAKPAGGCGYRVSVRSRTRVKARSWEGSGKREDEGSGQGF